MDNAVLFITQFGMLGASSRYRVLQYLPLLSAAGWRCSVHIPWTRAGVKAFPWRYLNLVLLLAESLYLLLRVATQRYTVVYVQKRKLPPLLLRLFRRFSYVVYDFDDAIFTYPTGKVPASDPDSHKAAALLRAILSSVDHAVAGNEYLAGFARQSAARVTIIPTPIPVRSYPEKHWHGDQPLRVVGWIGSAQNLIYVQALSAVFQQLSKQVPGFKLLIIADATLSIPGVVIEHRPWGLATELADLVEVDIGIMPLADDAWTRGKCAFKAIQYMGCGIPVVLSPVGMNLDLVRDGETGLFASQPSEWYNAIGHLLASPGLAADMGRRARAHVSEHYDINNCVSQLLGVLAEGVRKQGFGKP